MSKLKYKLEKQAREDCEIQLKKQYYNLQNPEKKKMIDQGLLPENLLIDSAKVLRIILEFYKREKKIKVLVLR